MFIYTSPNYARHQATWAVVLCTQPDQSGKVVAELLMEDEAKILAAQLNQDDDELGISWQAVNLAEE